MNDNLYGDFRRDYAKDTARVNGIPGGVHRAGGGGVSADCVSGGATGNPQSKRRHHDTR